MSDTIARSRFGGGAFLLGMLLASGFLAGLSHPAFEGSSLRRYCLSHDVEKVAVALFCWGLADLGIKASRFMRERRALNRPWFAQQPNRVDAHHVDALIAEVESQPRSIRQSWMAARLRAGLEFVRQKGSATGLDEHLRYLGELAADRSHGQFALVRVIAWMIPILGFLGTVVGITIAVANVSPTQLDSSLTEVTGGLAMAFDATAVALALAMMLMFSYFLVERSEGKLLQAVEDVSGDLLRHRFLDVDAEEHPSLAPIRALGETIIKHTAQLVEKQLQLWQSALSTTSEQTARLLSEQRQSVAEWTEQIRIASQLERRQTAELTERLVGLEAKFGESASQLARLLDQGEGLAPLQAALTDNLIALRQTQGLDDAMHSLTAAIHLLTARARPGVHDRAA